jgi:hypothetical protein
MDSDAVIAYPRIDAAHEIPEDPFIESPETRPVANAAPLALSPVSSDTHKDTAMTEAQDDHGEEDVAQAAGEENLSIHDHESPVRQDEMEDVRSTSDGSSPVHPVVRKSSLNLASLPAREPLTSKKSIGQRTSQMINTESGDSKTTTQRLHDRINMLKQSHHAKAAPPPPPASATPAVDGPISASKAKLSSILKSARGMMVRSAGTSAQAKMETYPASQAMSVSRGEREEQDSVMPDEEVDSEPGQSDEDRRKMESVVDAALREVQQAEEDRQKAMSTATTAQAQPPTVAVPATQKQKEIRRPAKRPDPKAAATNKPKPAPVAIRVGTVSQLTASHRDADQRKNGPTQPPPNAALAATLGQSLAPAAAAPSRPAGLQKKASNPSFSSSTSTTTLKSSTTGKPKALLAAARRKEQVRSLWRL